MTGAAVHPYPGRAVVHPHPRRIMVHPYLHVRVQHPFVVHMFHTAQQLHKHVPHLMRGGWRGWRAWM